MHQMWCLPNLFPLKQGLRHRIKVINFLVWVTPKPISTKTRIKTDLLLTNQQARKPPKPISTKTRIKTVPRRLIQSPSMLPNLFPLKQGLRQSIGAEFILRAWPPKPISTKTRIKTGHIRC